MRLHRSLQILFSVMLLCGLVAAANSDTAIDSTANTKPAGVAIGSAGFNEMLSKQLGSDALKTEALPDGSFKLTNTVQTLQAQVTAKGTTFTSTSKEQSKSGSFSLSIAQFGRDEHMQVAPSSDVYRAGENVFHAHDGITEKFSNTGNGIQQDFIIVAKPEGDGALQVQLMVEGAKLTTKTDGFTVALNGSQRTLTYDRLKVTDANNNTIPAHMQLLANNEIVIVVDDSAAQYPLTIDPTVGDANWFSMGGVSGANGAVRSIAFNGSDIYVGGDFTAVGNASASHIAKWNGNDWSALGTGVDSNVYALAFDATGNLYAGGDFNTAGGVTATTGIAKWDGNLWSSLGAGVNDGVRAIAIDTDGSIYAGGRFTLAGGVSSNYIAKWNGVTWSSLSSGIISAGFVPVAALAIDNAGNLIVGGDFSAAGGVSDTAYIAKWNGSLWSALGTGMNNAVRAIAVDNGGILYAGGDFTSAGGVPNTMKIAKWNGNAWLPLGTGMDSYVAALTVDSSGNLYAGGDFSTANGMPVNSIAKWDGTNWASMGSAQLYYVYALASGSSEDLIVGGDFISTGDVYASRLARWNGNAWLSFSNGITGADHIVRAIATDNNGNVYIGGQFSSVGGVDNTFAIAKWSGGSWSALGTGIKKFSIAGIVFALVTDHMGNLYVGGDFNDAGGVTTKGIAKWNGTTWSSLGTGISGTSAYVYAMVLDSAGNLYAGGRITIAGETAVNNIAKWNGATWTALGLGLNQQVFALTIDVNDSLYAGGQFTTAGGIASNRTAKWNGTTWSPLGVGTNGTVYALATDSNGNIYAGGGFTTAGGIAAKYIAQWNGSIWSTLGAGMGSSAGVHALTIDNIGTIYAGGYFTLAGETGANHVAKWDGTNWSPLGSGIDGPVYAMVADDGGYLFAGGYFSVVGTKVSANIGKWLIDSDNDGAPDINDNFPLDPLEWLDTDSDTIGNNADWDDDGDGIPDGIDADPLSVATATEMILPLDATSKGAKLNNAMRQQ